MQVSPLRIQLNAEKSISAVTVSNGGDEEISVQAEITEWTQANGQDNYQATRDVLVNPVIFKLPAKGVQIVRLGLRVPDSDAERSYRLFLQQLPSTGSAQAAGIRMQTLLRLGVPVFVPAGTPRIGLEWKIVKSHGGRIAGLEATNTGNTHVQLTRVAVRASNGRTLVEAPLSAYVLPGQIKVLPISVPLDEVAPGALLTIDQTSDSPVPLPSMAVPVRENATR